MPRRFPLEPLHTLASERLEEATRRLAQLKSQLQDAEAKLAQLQGFQEEYRARLGQAVAQGMPMARVRDFHVFLQKIESAIRQQQLEVERRRQEWERGQEAWLEERRRLKTYDVLKARHAQVEAVRAARQEQREQDDHARRSRPAVDGPLPPRRGS